MKQLKLFRKQFGFLDFLFDQGGSEQKQKTKTTTDKTVDVTTQQQGSTSTEQASQSTTELLSGDVQDLLTNVLETIATAGGADKTTQQQLSDISQQLFDRALGAQEAVDLRSEAIITQARRQGTKQLERLITDLSQQAGGSAKSNTFVASAAGEGIADLETNLAALESQLGLQGRQLQTEEFKVAIESLLGGSRAGATDAGAIANIANVLRGATSTTTATTTQEQQTQEEEIRNLIEHVDSLMKGTASTESEAGVFDLISLFF